MTKLNRLTSLWFAPLIAAIISGCGAEEPPAGDGFQMPPPPVDVAPVITKPVAEWKEFTGRLEASETVVVRPRVSGYVIEVAFTDGQLVKEGDLLFVIDQAKKIQEVKRLEADLKSAKTEIELAETDLERAQSLRKKNAIAQEQVDNLKSQLSKARTDAESVAADLGNAKIDLALTEVKAPIDGRVSKADVTVGNFVAVGQTVLTRVVSTEKMFAYFDADEQTYLNYQARRADQSGSGTGTVYMSLINENGHPHRGQIDFIDNQLNLRTGTIRFRAAFDNNAGQFTPGLFTRMKMQVGAAQERVLVAEKSISTDLNRKYVLVLGEGNVAEYRPIELGARMGSLRVVKSGLAANEKIVVSGLQRVRPGTPVTPTETTMATEEEIGKALSLERVNEAQASQSDPSKVQVSG